jgi:NAD(P)-dependent dehydrogenase (short-subunit alcohol dehydrogenase family)
MSNPIDRMNLSGKRAVVTGAGGTLGRAFTTTLASLGADLILIDLPGIKTSESNLIEFADAGIEISNFECNLEIFDERQILLEKIKSDFTTIDILVNNAAFVGNSELSGWSGDFESQTVESWRRALEVNLTAVFHLTQGLLPQLRNSETPNIINIASIYGKYGPDWSLYDGTEMGNPAAYSASKGGLIQFTRWLSTTLAPEIRVNAISPGGIALNQDPEFIQRYKKRTPLARMATPSDVAGTLAFLATDLSQYITGQNIQVDGGWGVW